jgi:ribonuclease HI
VKRVFLHCDGSCFGNPGPGGWAAILAYGGRERELSGGEPRTTNNRMELTAAIHGLRALKEPCAVTVRTDSRYVVNAFSQGWVDDWQEREWKNSKKQPVSNRDLWEALLAEAAHHRVTWEWVEGHAGDPFNERCHAAAVAACETARRGRKATAPKASHRGHRGGWDESSPWQEFERKRWSEEARLARCPECGNAEGRHMRGCSRAG